MRLVLVTLAMLLNLGDVQGGTSLLQHQRSEWR